MSHLDLRTCLRSSWVGQSIKWLTMIKSFISFKIKNLMNFKSKPQIDQWSNNFLSSYLLRKTGSFFLNSNHEEGVIEMPVIRYHVHRYFNRPRLFSNDIALIKWVVNEAFWTKKKDSIFQLDLQQKGFYRSIWTMNHDELFLICSDSVRILFSLCCTRSVG